MTYCVIALGININQLNKTIYFYLVSIKIHRKGMGWHVQKSYLCEGPGMWGGDWSGNIFIFHITHFCTNYGNTSIKLSNIPPSPPYTWRHSPLGSLFSVWRNKTHRYISYFNKWNMFFLISSKFFSWGTLPLFFSFPFLISLLPFQLYSCVCSLTFALSPSLPFSGNIYPFPQNQITLTEWLS